MLVKPMSIEELTAECQARSINVAEI